jgi:hypothetical protein
MNEPMLLTFPSILMLVESEKFQRARRPETFLDIMVN